MRSYRRPLEIPPKSQLPSVAVKTILQLGMRQSGGIAPVQETHQRLELLTAPRKPASYHLRCTSRITTRGRQEFTVPRVKFATTGVEIGGHAGHLRGRYVEFHVTTSTSRARLC